MTDLRAFLRNTWRGLTSMRTALILLFLLAVASFPGALLPQRSLNAAKTEEYIQQHGWWGRTLDQLGFFEAFASPWFAAIYVLLFISLIGCLIPRTVEYARQMVAKPVLTPRNLARMPHHHQVETALPVDEVLSAARKRLRGWRIRVDEQQGTISAERGYLRETGNLVFHFALLGLLVAFGAGKMFGYEGQVILLANGSTFCNSAVLNYDSFRAGLRVDGTNLSPFCLRVNEFKATYQHNGQPIDFQSKMDYQIGDDLSGDRWQQADVAVNHPLRIVGDRVYLQGHGYAPTFEVTFPGGEQRSSTIQWRPGDQSTFLSEGTTKFPDPPGITDEHQRRERQLAITGLFAPTAQYNGAILTSVFPDLLKPAVAVDVYRGDLGQDSGRSQSIFEIDQVMVKSGKLNKVARKNLELGQDLTLDDGTKIKFAGVEQFVSLQVSHDPAQVYVLLFSVLMIGGIFFSLTIKRRRWWMRATPAGEGAAAGRTVVDVGGLARTDQAGYGEEFSRLTSDLVTELNKRGA
ncbi:cytochrome c biogenesis protein ResB [Pseudonocardiaceae bacterium YIM PH 21723]|nr:cytochrome c biogenesis protein ResB [Pseudonocardiaceae bacterium YIM PH 21723]